MHSGVKSPIYLTLGQRFEILDGLDVTDFPKTPIAPGKRAESLIIYGHDSAGTASAHWTFQVATLESLYARWAKHRVATRHERLRDGIFRANGTEERIARSCKLACRDISSCGGSPQLNGVVPRVGSRKHLRQGTQALLHCEVHLCEDWESDTARRGIE